MSNNFEFCFWKFRPSAKTKDMKKVNLPPRLFRDLPKAKVLDKRQLNGSIGRRDLFTPFLVLQRSFKNLTKWGIDFFQTTQFLCFYSPHVRRGHLKFDLVIFKSKLLNYLALKQILQLSV